MPTTVELKQQKTRRRPTGSDSQMIEWQTVDNWNARHNVGNYKMLNALLLLCQGHAWHLSKQQLRDNSLWIKDLQHPCILVPGTHTHTLAHSLTQLLTIMPHNLQKQQRQRLNCSAHKTNAPANPDDATTMKCDWLSFCLHLKWQLQRINGTSRTRIITIQGIKEDELHWAMW